MEANDGWPCKHTGDGVCAAFSSPPAAVDAAIDAQRRLELPVRMGVATGEAELRRKDYFGPALTRAARTMGAGHGSQILVSATTAALLDAVRLVDLGWIAATVMALGNRWSPKTRISWHSKVPTSSTSDRMVQRRPGCHRRGYGPVGEPPSGIVTFRTLQTWPSGW